MNHTVPREICNPKRRIMRTKKDYYNFINANISSSNLFTTVYNYTDHFPMRSNYETAIIDRLWFDFDLESHTKGENGENIIVKNDCYQNMKTLHEWCLKHDYKHICRYTGSGFDVTIFTMKDCFIGNKKDCIYRAVDEIEKKLGVESDIKTKGDIARIHRITNTFNFKTKAKRFCIPLTQEMIDIGHKGIRKIAKQQQFNSTTFGTKYLDIRKHDKAFRKNVEELFSYDKKEIKDVIVDELSDMVPICIKYLLAKKNPDYNERRPIIVGLRELGFSEGETKQILAKYLDKQKFYHCVVEEGQLSHLYKSKRVIFPTQEGMAKLKSCPMEMGQFCENACRGCKNYNR